jgi:hypothetical protein
MIGSADVYFTFEGSADGQPLFPILSLLRRGGPEPTVESVPDPFVRSQSSFLAYIPGNCTKNMIFPFTRPIDGARP